MVARYFFQCLICYDFFNLFTYFLFKKSTGERLQYKKYDKINNFSSLLSFHFLAKVVISQLFTIRQQDIYFEICSHKVNNTKHIFAILQ